MKTVGLRELKNRLSAYVRQVRSGHAVLVTDRGQVVAELLPPRAAVAEPDPQRAMTSMVRRGVLSLGARNDPRLYRRHPRRLARGKLRRRLDEERSDR